MKTGFGVNDAQYTFGFEIEIVSYIDQMLCLFINYAAPNDI